MQIIKKGTVLGQFRIESRLGAGGMGAVFRATDTSLQREVALKVLDSRLCDSEEGIQRFQREARTIAQLRHPNLMHIYAVGESEGVQYFAMEYIKGTPLNGVLRKQGGKLKLSAALRVTVEIMAGLQKVHSQGIVHRDLKPANVMIDADDGRAILVDFGLSKEFESEGLTSDGSILGTPDYMSPEQIEGKELGPYTDIYSLGVMLYEMLSGTRPFTRKTTMQTLRAHCEFTPSPLEGNVEGMTHGLSEVIKKMMACNPQERYATIEEIAAALSAICRHPLLTRICGKESAQAPQKTVATKTPGHYKSSVSMLEGKKSAATAVGVKQPEKKTYSAAASGKYISSRSQAPAHLKIIAAIIALLLCGGLAWYFLRAPQKSTDTATTMTADNSPEKDLPDDTAHSPAPVPDSDHSGKTPASAQSLPVITYSPPGQPAPTTGISNPGVKLILRNKKEVNGYLTALNKEKVKILLTPKGNAEYKLSEIQSILSLESHTADPNKAADRRIKRTRPLRRNGR